MRAVNLIPADARRNGPSLSAGRPFLGLVAGLAIALLVTVLFATAHNRVSSREAQLAATQTSAAHWTAAAAAYTHDISLEQDHVATITGVKALTQARYHWSELLDQLARAMPADSSLSSLTSSATAASATTASPTSSSAASSSTTASDTPSGIELAACASSQSVVAQTMDNLRQIHGVSQVILASSTSTGSGASPATGGGACGKVSFSLSLSFTAPSAAAGTAAQATSAAHATTDPSPTTSSSGVSQ